VIRGSQRSQPNRGNDEPSRDRPSGRCTRLLRALPCRTAMLSAICVRSPCSAASTGKAEASRPESDDRDVRPPVRRRVRFRPLPARDRVPLAHVRPRLSHLPRVVEPGPDLEQRDDPEQFMVERLMDRSTGYVPMHVLGLSKTAPHLVLRVQIFGPFSGTSICSASGPTSCARLARRATLSSAQAFRPLRSSAKQRPPASDPRLLRPRRPWQGALAARGPFEVGLHDSCSDRRAGPRCRAEARQSSHGKMPP
jgi:hypothetical protein